jgi:purine-binding chemotaxis protein CheW
MGLSRQFLLFRQGASLFAVDLMTVREVLSPLEQSIAQVPNAPAFLVGLMNLRGEILAVADFGRFIRTDATQLDQSHSRILVFEVPDPQNVRSSLIHFGLLVSQVEGVLPLYPDHMVSAIEVSEELAPLLRGLYDCDGKLLMILDAEAIAQSKDW